MIVPLTEGTSLRPDYVDGAAICSNFETATANAEGNLSDIRRRAILDTLSSAKLGLTEKEQRAMGKCLAYFDHFNKAGAEA